MLIECGYGGVVFSDVGRISQWSRERAPDGVIRHDAAKVRMIDGRPSQQASR
jgi:hypothetical protein